MVSFATPSSSSSPLPVNTRKRPSDTTTSSLTAAAAASSSSSSSQHNTNNTSVPRIRVTLKRIHAIGHWTWNASDDVCGICQSAYEGTAPNVKYPGEDCPVVWGKCGHAYHLQCLSTWLQQPSSKNSCPLCRQEWEFGQNPTIDNNSNTNNNNNNNGGNDNSNNSSNPATASGAGDAVGLRAAD